MKTILVLAWHPSTATVLSAGGFTRLYEILKRSTQPIIVIDKYPSLYKPLASKQITIIEYGRIVNTTLLERGVPVLGKVLDRIVSSIQIIFQGIRIGSQNLIIYVPFSELPHLSLAGVVIKYLRHIPVVLCNLNRNTVQIDRLVNVWLHAKADRVITLTNSLKKELAQTGIQARYTNGVGFDPRPYHQNGKVAKKYDTLFIGRHIPEKGILELIEIWHILINRHHQSILLVTVGDIPQYLQTELSRQIKRYHLESFVTMVGPVSDDQKLTFLHQAKICVFPSLQEGWGIVPQEALASGLPVVVYDLPVYTESLGDSEAIIRVPIGDREQFASQIQQALTHYQRLQKIAASYQPPQTWQAVAQKEFAIINNQL